MLYVNTLKRLWTGLRNFLRPFPGLNDPCLYRYVALFVCSYHKRMNEAFFGALLDVKSAHHLPCVSH